MIDSRRIPWVRLVAEVSAIVFGILLAFAIDAWYDGRVAREREAEYEQRIAVELGELRGILDRIARLVDRASDFAVEITGSFYSATGDVDHDWLVAALYNVGRDYVGAIDTSNYQDLVSTGSLALISDTDRRQEIQRAYASIQEVERARDPRRDEYLLGVRGWIPQEFIDKIQATCPSMGDVEWDCPPIDFDDELVEQIVMRVSTDDAFLAFQLRRQGLNLLGRRVRAAIDDIDIALTNLR